MLNLRKYEKETATHADFSFVTKDDDYDFVIEVSPPRVLKDKNGRGCLFIKANVPSLYETFMKVSWQSNPSRAIVGGSSITTIDGSEVVTIYDLFLAGKIPETRGQHKNKRTKYGKSKKV